MLVPGAIGRFWPMIERVSDTLTVRGRATVLFGQRIGCLVRILDSWSQHGMLMMLDTTGESVSEVGDR